MKTQNHVQNFIESKKFALESSNFLSVLIFILLHLIYVNKQTNTHKDVSYEYLKQKFRNKVGHVLKAYTQATTTAGCPWTHLLIVGLVASVLRF